MSASAQPFHDLPFSSQLIVWAARMWIQAGSRASAGGSHLNCMIRDSFRLAGAKQAFVALDGILSILAVTSTTPIEFQRPKCETVSADERRLLSILAILQSDEGREAAHFLAPLFFEMGRS